MKYHKANDSLKWRREQQTFYLPIFISVIWCECETRNGKVDLTGDLLRAVLWFAYCANVKFFCFVWTVYFLSQIMSPKGHDKVTFALSDRISSINLIKTVFEQPQLSTISLKSPWPTPSYAKSKNLLVKNSKILTSVCYSKQKGIFNRPNVFWFSKLWIWSFRAEIFFFQDSKSAKILLKLKMASLIPIKLDV